MKRRMRWASLFILLAFATQRTAYAMDFVQIHANSFMMGSPSTELFHDFDENLHPVLLTHDFEIQTTEVTQKQYFQVMGNNPSSFKNMNHCPETFRSTPDGFSGCPSHPVESVSYVQVQAFIKKLNAQSQDSYIYRLPTEAEFEFAARAGSHTAYSYGDDPSQLALYGWFAGNSVNHTHEVALLAANAYGLYDMHGNVGEWVSDIYASDYNQADPTIPQVDPQGPGDGYHHVVRGGSWYESSPSLRSANRWGVFFLNSGPTLGFRVVRVKINPRDE